MEIKRGDHILTVRDQDAGISVANVGNTDYADITIKLRGADELLLHGEELEIYIARDRLSELHAMLGTFLSEMKERDGKR